MRQGTPYQLGIVVIVLFLTACAPWSTTPTPMVSTPPPSSVTPKVIVLTSTAAPGTTPVPRPPTTINIPGTSVANATQPITSTSTPRPSGPGPGGTGIPRTTKLTADNCCVLPRWLPDSSGIYFYAAAGQIDPRAGLWTVSRDGGTPQFNTALYGTFSPDLRLVAFPDGALTHVAQPDGLLIATIQNDGRRTYIPRTNDQVAWLVPAAGVPVVSISLDPPFQIAIMRLNTKQVTIPPAVFVGETLSWFPDGRQILVNGRDSRAEHPGLWVLDTGSGAVRLIVEARGLESPLISPDGQKIAYTATLQQDPAANGVWVINADGSGKRHLNNLSGGYRWAPDSQNLLYIPAPTERPNDELWRYTLADNTRTPLVNNDQLPFTIAQNEWELSPDGKAIVYRSATDNAIWVLRFAP